jgi:hypothetical protein
MDSGISADDRRAALAELKDLLASNPQAQLAVGHIGLHVLCAVLREDRDDVELVRGALEALLQAVTRHADKAAQGVEPAAVNAELLSRDPRTLTLLLSLLDEEDFYVRYHALQLLSSLMASNQHQVQGVVLANPHGMLRLLDLVSDREAIRNEALLLLNTITRGKEEIQKLLAFEGALERLFGIVAEEGGAEGGVVVQDCLELVNNLLRACAPNQVLFRESGLAHKLPALLVLRSAASSALSKQAAANVLCALEVVLVLASPTGGDAAATVANQAALKKAGVLDAILPLSLGGAVRFSAVRTVARLCAAAVIAGSLEAQEALAAAFVNTAEEGDARDPALLVLLQAVLHSSDPIECSAAERLVSAYCDRNPTGQVLLVSTLAPMADTDSGASASFGSKLAAALFDTRPEVATRAVSLLQHLLLDNSAAKEQLLRTPLDAPSAGSGLPTLFMSCCTRMLSDAVRAAGAVNAALQVSLLRLLLVWVHDCPPAIASLLSSPAHLPLLVDCTMRGDAHVAGFSAAVLGCCMISNMSSECTAQTVLDVIVSRVTLAEYFLKWEHMLTSDEFVAASSATGSVRPLVTRSSAASAFEGAAFFAGWRSVGDSTYGAPVVALLKRLEPAVRAGVLALYARPKQTAASNTALWEVGETESDKAHVTRLKALLQSADVELAELRSRNSTLAQQLLLRERDPAPIGASDAPPAQTPAAVDTSAQELLSRVRQDAERDLAAARADCEEARQAGARHEESLKALSQAYNALEAAHFRLEEELRHASAGSAADGGVSLERLRAAVAEARQAGVAEGAAAASAEHEQEMGDLLVCLGQEEAKVERLCRELEARGVDTSPLLAADDEAE